MMIFGVLATRLEPAVTVGLREVERGDDFATVAWDDSGDADSWDVYIGGLFVTNVTVPTYTAPSLSSETSYSFQVSSRNAEGASALSAAVVVTTLAAPQPTPDAPTGFALDDIAFARAVFVWDSAENVAEWDVLRDAVVIGTVTSPTYTDTTATPGSSPEYTVVARNAAGDSDPSDPITVDIPENSPPEWSMTDKAGSVGDSFSFNLNNETFDADGHARTFSIISGGVPGGALVNGVYAGTYSTAGTHQVVFEADDGHDQTQHTVNFVVAALPDTTKPSIPGNRTVSVSGSSATFDWDESTDASDIKCYRIRKAGVLIKDNIGGIDFASGAAGAVDGPPYTITGLPNGTYDDYTVRSVDNSPAQNFSVEGAFPSFTINVAPPAPDVPINFNVQATGSTSTASSWAPGPNGAAPTRYTIERSLSGAGAQDPNAAGWSLVFDGLAQLDADSGLTAGTTYTYRIRAYNGTVPSTAYAVDTVTTDGASGIVWPGTARSGGPSWHSGAGSCVTGISSFEGLTGHQMDVYTEWTGKYNDTWTTVREGGSGKFVTALDTMPDTTPIVHIWPLVPNSEKTNNNRWEDLRDGLHDADLEAGFLAMKNRVLARGRALNTIIFDVGHEMSGTWYAWSLIDGATKIQAFKDAWCHHIDILRDYFPTSLICFRPARRQGGASRSITLNQMLPPNTHFDLIGRSLHDENPHVNRDDPTSWLKHVEKARAEAMQNIGLEHVAEECRNRGKKMLFAEWGTQIAFDGGSHEPNVFGPSSTAYFIEKAYEWFFANRDILLAETIFQPSDSRLWGTRSNTATDPLLSQRHEAAKAAYNANSRWGAD